MGGRGGILRRDMRKPAIKIGEKPAKAGPRSKSPRIHPGIDQRQRNATPVRCNHQTRPKILLRPDGKIRPPVIKKRRHRPRRIQRQKLMPGAGRHVAPESLRRRPRRRGDQKRQIGAGSPHRRNQTAQCQNLAQTHRMHPDQRAAGTGQPRCAQLFTPAVGVFLAARKPSAQQKRQQRRSRPHQQQIRAQ